MLYCICTKAKETEEMYKIKDFNKSAENVHKFLETHTEFELEQMRQYFPYEGCDGFFMAKMHRR